MHPFLLKHSLQIVFVITLFELLYAVYMDLKTAKFPNKFFLSYLGVNMLLVIVLRGFGGLPVAAITMVTAVALLTPIYLTRILGGGDIKLIFSLSPLLLLNEFLGFLLMSFVWAGVFGLFRNLLGGNLRALLVNTFYITRKVTVAQEAIPFTVGILLGWLSYESIIRIGVL